MEGLVRVCSEAVMWWSMDLWLCGLQGRNGRRWERSWIVAYGSQHTTPQNSATTRRPSASDQF